MSVFTIQNWRFGLDTRRSELTSQPGVLETAQNVHINQGAEIEKRKAFVPAVTNLADSAFSANVFGLEVSGGNMVAFGSAAVGAITVPAGVTYLQCAHPTNGSLAMTAVLCSCSFGGQAFCVAQFSDGSVFWYLNGVIIPASIAGQVLTTTVSTNGSITVTTNPTAGNSVTIGNQTYRFESVMSQAYDVKIGATAIITAINLYSAINGLGTPGVSWYGTGAGGTSGSIQSNFVSAVFPGASSIVALNVLPSVVGTLVALTQVGIALTLVQFGLNTNAAQTTAQIVAQMYNILSGTAFTDAGVFVENLSATGFNVYTSYGVTWTPTVDVVSSDTGQINTSLLSTGTAPVAAGTGSGVLTLYAGTTGSLATLTDVASNGTFKLITAAVPFDTNVSQTANDIASKITSQAPSALAISASNSTNQISIAQGTGATTVLATGNYLQYSLSAGSNLCFENMSLDFSNVTTSPTVKNIYTTNGVNLCPSGLKYNSANGLITGNPNGSYQGLPCFVLPLGTYLWIPGVNDTEVVFSGGTPAYATNYPQGYVGVYNNAAGTSTFHGKPGQPPTFQLFAMTDILNSAGTTLSNPPTTAQITSIAAAITGNNGSWVASNTGVGGTAGTEMWISRSSSAITASNYAGIYFYTNIVGVSPSGLTAITPPAQYGIGQQTAAVTGRGSYYQVQFTGTWEAGDQYTFDIVTAGGTTYTVGIGNLTGLVPTACITLSNRVHVIAGPNWLGSDNGDATQWEQQAPGAFSINVSQQFRQADTLISLAAYQGRIALFANYVIMIWVIDANPINITMQQALANIGTFAPLGPQSLGDFDVVFPSVTGFRSLRVRDLSLNAYVNDLGSPVDLLMQADINALGFGNLAGTVGILEPSANRYWFFINGHIYVLSYFPSAKINAAWSLYTPTFFNGASQESFVPVKFLIYNSQVYFVATYAGTNYLFVFGGANNTTYDATPAIVATPWYDMGTPTIRKSVKSLDYAMTNAWQFAMGMDYYGYINNAGQLKGLTTVPSTNVAFQLGQVPISLEGYHLKLQATCNAAGYAVISALDVGYEKEDEK